MPNGLFHISPLSVVGFAQFGEKGNIGSKITAGNNVIEIKELDKASQDVRGWEGQGREVELRKNAG